MIFEFRDVPLAESVVLVQDAGERVQSCMAALRDGTDFELLIMLLTCDDLGEGN